MKLKIAIILLTSIINYSVSAFDAKMAKSYEQYFKEFSGKATMKAMQMILAPDFIAALNNGEEFYVIDVRTSKEVGFVGLNLPGSIAIPMEAVFKPDNLKKIPTDKKVVVICKSGCRAIAVATGLRHSGFKNIYLLKNGIDGLTNYLSPKTAFSKTTSQKK